MSSPFANKYRGAYVRTQTQATLTSMRAIGSNIQFVGWCANQTLKCSSLEARAQEEPRA